MSEAHFNSVLNICLLLLGLLLIIVIIESLIIYKHHRQAKKKKNKKGKNRSSSTNTKTVSMEDYKKVCKERNNLSSQVESLCSDYEKIKRDYKKLEKLYQDIFRENTQLQKENREYRKQINKLQEENAGLTLKISELTRENDEQAYIINKGSNDNNTETYVPVTPIPSIVSSEIKEKDVEEATSQSSTPTVQGVVSGEGRQETYTTKEETRSEQYREKLKDETSKLEPKVATAKEKIMYASFPRSAGSSIYFSDLSESRVEDSYFELKILATSGKATFKPLDFMKIRNYDPAMVAMRTEGVKPNVASTVQGIEYGEAHIEGKDWVIDKPAKIKLA